MPKTNGASKTNVTARLGAKKATVEQVPQRIDLSGMRSSVTSVVTSFPKGLMKREPATDDERRAVADFEAGSKVIRSSNPKTAGAEAGYFEAFSRMRRYGLVD